MGEIILLKKRYLFLIFIICLFAVSTVSAADNVTDDEISVNDASDNIISSEVNIDDIKLNDFNLTSKDLKNGDEFLCSTEDGEVLSYSMDEDILGASPPHSAYSVDVSDTSINYGSSGYIYMYITPASSSYDYRYDFYLKVYDSEGNQKISQMYYSTSYNDYESYYISSYALNSGNYTIKIINYYDDYVMGTANLYVVSVPYYAYSVDVSDTQINYGAGGYIYMYITPASSSYSYKYDFYLKVYDSEGNLKINERYYSTSYNDYESYYISSNKLDSGKYTIKIINYYDDYVMGTANLYVVSVPYYAYSVDVSDTQINYGAGGYIYMYITPASSSYSYKYDFYLKVYDSEGNLKINERYYSTSYNDYESYYISSNKLDSGKYTIKIINYYDDHVMNSANLYVVSVPYTAYSVDVSDTIINYKSSGYIYMSISPASSSYYYKYDFYLKVYDSNDDEVISERYSGTSSAYSKSYYISSTDLDSGKYKIKIINCYDDYVMDTANLDIVFVPYTAYSVDVSDTRINYGFGGNIDMSISPASSSYYNKYDFYLKVYDSKNNEVISQRYYSTSSDDSETYYIYSDDLNLENYTIKIINCYDDHVMDTANLYVVSVPYTAYSVDVSETIINYRSSGSIYMSISPANSSYYYKYDFYLKVYDSNDDEVISERYSGTSSAYSKSYYINSNKLDSGKYKIKIFNYYDNAIMDTANLYVVSVPYTAYSVDVSDTRINYGADGYIYMSISPANSSLYYNKYDFYLKVYDSNDDEVISQRYYGTSSAYSKSHYIYSNVLNLENYTIRIINSQDHYVMDTANLYVVSVPYTGYSVSVSDTRINYGAGGNIDMSISSASSSFYYKYDFYLKVYDSNDDEVISQRYYSTYSYNSESYYISSNKLDSGNYTIRIINCYDGHVMGTANLYVVSVPYTAYSVSVSDKTINYGYSGYIDMSISPANSSFYYKYDFYLKVYDSKDDEVISQRYSGTSSAYSKSHYIYSNELNPGKYTINIINNYDNHVMGTAKLYIRNSKNLQLYSEDYYVGDSVNMEYYIVSGATGTLSVYINDTFIKNVSVDNNKKINLGKMAYGVYKIKVVYKSNNYYSYEDSTTFEVRRFTPTLMLSVNNITVNNYDSFETNIFAGSNVILQFMFDEDLTGKINVKHESDFDNNTNTLKLVNGKASLSISKILGDYHLFTITYAGNNKYSPFNLECELIFKCKTPTINYEIPNNLLWGDRFVINPVLPKDATGKINITVKDYNEYYFKDSMKIKDKYYFTILNGGKNYLKLDYLGDGIYEPCTGTVKNVTG